MPTSGELDTSSLTNSPQSWDTGCTLHSSLSLLSEKPQVVHLLCTMLTASHHLVSPIPAPLFSQWLSSIQIISALTVLQSVKGGETETSPSGNPLKSWNFRNMLHSSLCPQGRSYTLGPSLRMLNCAGLGQGAWCMWSEIVLLSCSLWFFSALCSPRALQLLDCRN